MMPVSHALAARRALVKVMRRLARANKLKLDLAFDATDAQVLAAYKRLARKCHPDKGGRTAHMQELQAAKNEWDKSKDEATSGGRPQEHSHDQAPADSRQMAEVEKDYRIRSQAVLLTFSGVADLAQWRRFFSSKRKT